MPDLEDHEIVLKKLTTRNFIAVATTSTMLIVLLQMTFNAKEMLVIVQDNAEWVVTGAFVFGGIAAKWADIVQFFFRRPQAKESKE